MRVTDRDVDIMARTIYGEARGEILPGKIAVAYVILNRVNARSWYGKTISGVCQKKFQFSCWNENDPNRPKLENVDREDPAFRLCLYAALVAIHKLLPDQTGGATHYHTESVKPAWTEGKQPCKKIGVHLFYKGID